MSVVNTINSLIESHYILNHNTSKPNYEFSLESGYIGPSCATQVDLTNHCWSTHTSLIRPAGNWPLAG